MKTEILDTKVTRLSNGLYGCRIIDLRTGKWIVEGRVPKVYIGGTIKAMLRTLDKLCYDSPMAHASRHRNTPYFHGFKCIWNK